LIYTFNKDTSTADDCLEFISEMTDIRKDRLLLCLGKNDEVKAIIPPNSTDLMSAIIEDLNGPKFVHCRLICFEVKLGQVDRALDLDEFVPVVLKYEKTLKSINDFLSQNVKTGSISLLLVDKKNSDRQIYSQITDLFKDILSVETLELLSREYTDNLISNSSLTTGQSPVQSDTKSTTGSTQFSKENPVKKDAGKAQQNSTTVTTNHKDGKGKNPKVIQPQINQSTGNKSPAKGLIEEKSSPQMIAEPKVEEEYTFHDVLNEVILGFLPLSSASNLPCISDKPDLKEELAHLSSIPQVLSVRYSNGHKLRCLNCGKPGYHTCKAQSSSGSRLAELCRALRDGKASEAPVHAVPLSVLVCSERALALLEKRALGDDGGRGIQIKSNIDINYCLENMQKKEDMGKDSLVDCSKCGKKTEREVCYIIEKAPKLFLIQLKRFKTDIDYKTGTIEKRKVCIMIELKENLAIKDQQFELFGVVNHYGEIDKGHYTACVKRPSDNQWFLYDDEKVTKISFKDVNSEGAYLLFYQLKTV
jgi:hypothetical protein